MVQAASRSGLSFHDAALRDRYWWLKVRWLLDQLETENMLEVYKMQHAQHLSVLDYSLAKPTFDNHWKGGNDILKKAFVTRFPWHDKHSAKDRDSEISGLMSAWKAKYGDMRDPAVYKKYAGIAKAIRERGEKAKANQFKDQGKLGRMVQHMVKQKPGRKRSK